MVLKACQNLVFHCGQQGCTRPVRVVFFYGSISFFNHFIHFFNKLFMQFIIPDELLRRIMGFVVLYIAVFIIASLVIAGLGVDMITAFGSVAACIGNIGPGFGTVGPADNFAHLPVVGKWLLALCMLLGRLEIYTVIIIFVPEFWKK